MPIDQYEENLEALVKRMKKTGAKLIWRNTTPVPQGAKGRLPKDVIAYNRAAARVMKKHKVQTHDLYSFAKEHEEEIQLPKNVHYTKKGSELLAQEVVKVIEATLEKGDS